VRHVPLGQTDLEVSAIAFGTWAFRGGWGAADRNLSADDLRRNEAIAAAVPMWGPTPKACELTTTPNDHAGSAT
jgi:hypothetical protein